MPKGKAAAKKVSVAKKKVNNKKPAAKKKNENREVKKKDSPPKKNPRKIVPRTKTNDKIKTPEKTKKKVVKVNKRSPVRTVAGIATQSSSPIKRVSKSPVKRISKSPVKRISKSPIRRKELPVIEIQPKKKVVAKSPPLREKKCTIPTSEKLEEVILSILNKQGNIRFNLIYQYEIGTKNIYSSVINKKFKGRKGAIIVIVETITITSNPTNYELDTKIVASTTYEANNPIIINQGSYPYLDYNNLYNELNKRTKETVYTDYYLLLTSIGCTSEKSISEKVKELLETLIKTTVTSRNLKAALSIIRGGQGNPPNIDNETYNSLLRLSSAFLLKDNISYLDSDVVPTNKEIRVLRNNFNILLGKEPENITNSAPVESLPIKSSLKCSDNPTKEECVSMLIYWSSKLFGSRSIRAWIRTNTSKKGYNEKNIIISATSKGYKLTVTSTVIPYDTNTIEELFSEIEAGLNLDRLETELNKVYKDFLFIDFYLYISIIAFRSSDCLSDELSKQYLRKVLGNTGISIRITALLIDQQEIPPLYSKEMYSIAYRLYGSLIGNSERFSIVDVSNWNNTEVEKTDKLMSLFQELAAYRPS